VLDRNDMKGHYLVMDNAAIHTPVKVRALVESRGYTHLYLSSYSPFLNPIEEFWSKVKAEGKTKCSDS
jgi:transposase